MEISNRSLHESCKFVIEMGTISIQDPVQVMPREHEINVKIYSSRLTVSCAAPLMPRSWLKLEPLAVGALSGA